MIKKSNANSYIKKVANPDGTETVYMFTNGIAKPTGSFIIDDDFKEFTIKIKEKENRMWYAKK